MGELPVVSLVLPIRNEARYIALCLDGLASQDYPHDRIQILVVDGMSDDGTRDIVKEWFERWKDQTFQHSNLLLIDNPERIAATALNRGIRASRGEIIIRVDGHAVISADYVSQCVQKLANVHADCVGGPIRTVGNSWVSRGIAIGASSPFGVGNAAFRYAHEGQFVDTLAFGAYRREVFERIGSFDEHLVRNQDDEFNFRLIRSGGKIWLDPAIRSTYYSRATIASLWRQYFGYGFWKVRVIQKHRRPASWRHLVPISFVLVLSLAFVLSLVTWSPVWFMAVALPYALASVAVTLWVGAQEGWQYAPLLLLVFLTMHLSYGFGFLFALMGLGLGLGQINAPVRQSQARRRIAGKGDQGL